VASSSRRRLAAWPVGLWLSALAACGGPGEAARPPDVALIVVDTLRADVLSAYGGPVGAGGAIEALAARGVLFEDAQATSPWTGPSVASLLTGRYPDEIGIHDIRDPLPRSATNLAQRLQTAGHATGAVVSNYLAGPAYGHDKGYDRFLLRRYKDRRHGGRPRFTADRVTEEALAWLRSRARDDRRPFFLHVHYTDPHEPYLPPEPYRSRFRPEGQPLSDDDTLQARFAAPPLRAEAVAAARAAYAGEVAFVDHEIGRLLAGLPAATLVLLTADHGEEFLDHGGLFHGHSLYRELVHVPLVVAGPGVPSGRRVREVVSHVDVVPTLLELCDVAAPARAFSGRSLVPLLSGEGGPGPAVHAVLERDGRRLLAVRIGAHKLIEAAGGGERRLYDLTADPLERSDLAGTRPDLAAALAARIAQRRAAAAPIPDAARGDGLAEARERELRALGYVRDGAPSP
jgi:arylsulfatase A-like enzyme